MIQSALCVLVAAWLAVAAIDLYVEGSGAQASGELFHCIYTREKVAEKLAPMLPLPVGAAGMTAVGWILGIKDARADRPVRDPENQRNLTCARVKAPGRAVHIVRAVVLALAVAFILAGILNGGLEDVSGDAPAGFEAGDRLADFTTDLIGGGEFRLADCRGRIVMINLWATYCAPCVEELPFFDELAARYPDLEVLAIHHATGGAEGRQIPGRQGVGPYPVRRGQQGQEPVRHRQRRRRHAPDRRAEPQGRGHLQRPGAGHT